MKIPHTKAFAGCGVTLMDRVQGNAGTNITQASITGVAYTVKRYDSLDDAEAGVHGTSVVASTSLTVSTVVYDTLQTAAPWDSSADSTGYNVRYNSLAADRPNTASDTVWDRYQFTWTPVSGAMFSTAWIVETLVKQ